MPDRLSGDTSVITLGTTDTVASLDPAGAYDAGSWALFSNVYQSLLTFKPGADDPVYDAARECQYDGKDQLTYVCRLRDGLKFNNGDELTAEDVKFSFDRMRRINARLGPASLLNTLKSVSTRGRDTVIFELATLDATFPHKLATGAGAILDHAQYPQTSVRTGTSNVIGSGPYILKEYVAGSRAVLVPNPDYKGAAGHTGQPVTIRYYEGADALNKAWQAEEFDVATRRMPPAELAAASTDSAVRATDSAGSDIRNLIFNMRADSPMREPAIRKAIALTLDRQRLAQQVYSGMVEPLYSLIPQGVTAHTTAYFDAYPQSDAAAAKKLLADAGVKTPVAFQLAHSQTGAGKPEAAEIRQQLEATGLFTVKVTEYETAKFREGYSNGLFDAYTLGWLPDFPDPDTYVAPLVGSDTSLKNGYSNNKIDQLIAKSRGFAKRADAVPDFRTVQELVAKDVPLIPLWQGSSRILSRPGIGGTQNLSDGSGVWRLWELSTS
jgi:peptide/nickel transport system substrate-binding protein